MEWYQLHCPDCGYDHKIVIGTPSPTESFDLNEDFSNYVPILCRSCKSVISLDLHDKKRKPSCGCGEEPEPLTEQDLKDLNCPDCGSANFQVTKANPE